MWMLRTLFLFCCLASAALWGQCHTSVLENLVNGIACASYTTKHHVEDNTCQKSELSYSKSSLHSSQSGKHDLQATRNDENRSGREGALQMQSSQGNSNSSWPLETLLFKLLQGKTLSCPSNSGELSHMKLPLKSRGIISSCDRHISSPRKTSDNLEKIGSELPNLVDKSRWPQVEVTPSQLNLVQSFSYVPSSGLSVKNTCNPSDLNIEPFDIDKLFYPYDIRRTLIGSGESISTSFVYLPLSLGSPTANSVMLTSSGSLLIQAEDLEFWSPLVGLDMASGCWWSGSLCFSNAFKETIQLGEVSIRASVCDDDNFLFAKVLCQEGNCQDLLTRKNSDAKNCLDFTHSCSRQHLESDIGNTQSARTGHRKMSPSSAKTLENIEGDKYAPLNVRSQGITGSFSMFDQNLLLHDISTQSSEDVIYAMGKPVIKELRLTNIGGLLIKVSRISISGTECELDGFYVHECQSFSLEPGESTVLQISYLPNLPSATLVQRDLELALDTGTVIIPMKAYVPLYMLGSSWKSMIWLLIRKCCLAASIVVCFMMFVVFFLLPHNHMDLCSFDEFIKGRDESSIGMPKEAKLLQSLPSQKNQKCGIVADKMAVEVGCGIHGSQSTETWKQGSNIEQLSLLQNKMLRKGSISTTKVRPCALASTLIPMEDFCQSELFPKAPIPAKEESASQTVDLTIRTGKQRRKRQKKKKDSPGVGLIGSVEVASSNSGASTPSSPMSPLYAFTSRRPSSQEKYPKALEVPCVCDKNPEIQLCSRSSILKAKVSVKDSDKIVAKQAVPSMPLDFLPVALTPTIPLHARAPGPNLLQVNKHPKADDKFTYDIWGKHFSWAHLGPDEVSVMGLGLLESECNSFFLYGPQSRASNSKSRCVSSCNQRSMISK